MQQQIPTSDLRRLPSDFRLRLSAVRKYPTPRVGNSWLAGSCRRCKLEGQFECASSCVPQLEWGPIAWPVRVYGQVCQTNKQVRPSGKGREQKARLDKFSFCF